MRIIKIAETTFNELRLAPGDSVVVKYDAKTISFDAKQGNSVEFTFKPSQEIKVDSSILFTTKLRGRRALGCLVIESK